MSVATRIGACPRTHSGRHDLKDTVIIDEALRVLQRPCKACRALVTVGSMCMVTRMDGKPCPKYPTRPVRQLGGVCMCGDHLLSLGAVSGGLNTTAAGHGVRLSRRQQRQGY